MPPTEDLDAYLFLGDYIYERGRPVAERPAHRSLRRDRPALAPPQVPHSTARDAGLRELHRLHPALHVWDDHEVENNYSDNLPGARAAAADRRLPRRRSSGSRAPSTRGPPPHLQADRARRDRRPVPARRAPVPDRRQRRPAAPHPRRRADALADRRAQELARAVEADRAAGEHRRRPVRRPASARHLGRLSRGPRAAARRDRAARDRATSCSSPATRTCSRATCSRATSPRSATAPRHRPPRSSTSAARSPRWARQARGEVRSRRRGTASTTGATTATRCCRSTAAQLVTEYRRTDISSPIGATEPFERFTQPVGVNNITREVLAFAV